MVEIELTNEQLAVITVSMAEISKLTAQGKTNWQPEYAKELLEIANKFQEKHNEVALQL